MTVEELIEKLEQFDLDAEVRIASQPAWPMQHAVADVAAELDRADGAVYIVEGGQAEFDSPYLPEGVVEVLSW